MKHLFVLIFALLTTFTLSAQQYMTAGGIRLGTDWGITVQQRIAKKATLEGIFQSSLQREEIMLTLLAEQHFPIFHKGLNIYGGAGLHKGFLNEKSTEIVPTNYTDPFGVTLVGGAELTLGRINLSYDIKPAINVMGGSQKVYMQSGVSIRYVFLNNKYYKQIQKKKKKKKRQEEGGVIRIKDEWKIWKKKN